VESSELIAILRDVRDRVRASTPETARGGTDIALPDLIGLLRARDAAMGKVAAIGTVNPRSGGAVNRLIQAWKRLLARVLDWHVREQVEFNRTAIACVDAAIDALNQSNLALVDLGNRLAAERAQREAEQMRRDAEEASREELERVRREAERDLREVEQARRDAEQVRRGELAWASHDAELARREEAEQARRDAEYARRVAERARREDIEQVRRDAEEARRDEIEQALRGEIEQVRRDAERDLRAAEEARRADEQVQREAEQARRDAEHARRVAEQARREEAELARRVDERIQREAEQARRDAEHARRVAEQARRDEIDQAHRAAEETSRQEAERTLRDEIEQLRRDAERDLRAADKALREEAMLALRDEIERVRRDVERDLRAAEADLRAAEEAHYGTQQAERAEERAGREAEQARRDELERHWIEQMSDVLKHWEEWRVGWEKKLATNEMQFLRGVADLEGTFQYRLTLMDGSYRDTVRSQHADFTSRLDQRGVEIQKRLWADMEKVRAEFDKLIHVELRLIRQRLGARFQSLPAAEAGTGAAPSQAAAGLAFDYARFAEAFRGSEERVQEAQGIYLDDFRNCTNVLDIGCGRGEFLELMREAGVQARGIDSSLESIALCREKNLPAEIADLFEYLRGLDDGELDGIFCSQVVEHLPPERLPEMVGLAASKLRRGGVIAIETPNPECLAIFSTYFYLDPTHYRPVPHKLLTFYLSEFGIGDLQVRYLEQAMDSMPSLAELPEAFREAFFGGLDYSIVGRKV
jgi:O-antigen chain-terminating methyltransferase